MCSRVLTLLSFFLAVVIAAPAAAAPNWREEGPRSLIVTYKVDPPRKTAFRASLRSGLLPRLESLKGAGAISTYHVLVNRYLDSGSWDAMLIADFKDADALARWREVERTTPGGLEDKALGFVSEAASAPSDLMFSGAAPSRPGDPAPVYLVIPYDYLVPVDEYLAYVGGYLVPQTDGWIQSGALQSYGIYLPRYPAGRSWSAELVLAYRGDAGLARRDAVVQAVRTHLSATSPEWKSFADNKKKLRTEMQPVVADELLPGGS